MRAMVLEQVVSLDEVTKPLRAMTLPDPQPDPGDVLIRVSVCGVCHTELDEIEGRLRPARLPIVLGHQVVGRIEAVGDRARRFQVGQRVGVGWIHHSTGNRDENLAPEFRATGCDVDGGYAELMTVPEMYAEPIPETLADVEAAPLMCAGAIGFRSVRLAGIEDGQSLGLMGFGSSAHLVLQMVQHLYPHSSVYVFDRSESVREFALTLGATWAGAIDADSPEPLQAIIDTTPVWRPVVESLKKLRPGGRLVINAIRKVDADKNALLDLSYHDHLWMEREIKSVANLTHFDIAEFLPLAGKIPLKPRVSTFPLEAANEALSALHCGSLKGSTVLIVDQHGVVEPEQAG